MARGDLGPNVVYQLNTAVEIESYDAIKSNNQPIGFVSLSVRRKRKEKKKRNQWMVRQLTKILPHCGEIEIMHRRTVLEDFV